MNQKTRNKPSTQIHRLQQWYPKEEDESVEIYEAWI